MDIPEHFLHFIWQYRFFKVTDLYCTSGACVRILNPGLLNKNAGPDFQQVKLEIDGLLWLGDVEIHLRSSDWLVHGHQRDQAYDTVILHVVYEHDQEIYRSDGTLIPVLVMAHLFPEKLLYKYRELMESMSRFPCQHQLKEVDAVYIQGFLSRVLIERLEQKSTAIFEHLARSHGDWEDVLYHFLAQGFGFKVNSFPFEQLARHMPFKILTKHRDHALQVEALLFGQAGFLNGHFQDVYPQQLQREYLFLKQKYGLKTMNPAIWRFLRMRPQNFPSLRLAQFSAMLLNSSYLFSRILEATRLPDLVKLFKRLPVHAYWSNHYHFHKTADKVSLQLGLSSIYHLLINVVCIVLFSYGKYTGQPILVNRAIRFMSQLPAENNVVSRIYSAAGMTLDNAFFSQAVLQLNKSYCAQKKCLNCGIGIKILNK